MSESRPKAWLNPGPEHVQTQWTRHDASAGETSDKRSLAKTIRSIRRAASAAAASSAADHNSRIACGSRLIPSRGPRSDFQSCRESSSSNAAPSSQTTVEHRSQIVSPSTRRTACRTTPHMRDIQPAVAPTDPGRRRHLLTSHLHPHHTRRSHLRQRPPQLPSSARIPIRPHHRARRGRHRHRQPTRPHRGCHTGHRHRHRPTRRPHHRRRHPRIRRPSHRRPHRHTPVGTDPPPGPDGGGPAGAALAMVGTETRPAVRTTTRPRNTTGRCG
jgi:hypothetical protein